MGYASYRAARDERDSLYQKSASVNSSHAASLDEQSVGSFPSLRPLGPDRSKEQRTSRRDIVDVLNVANEREGLMSYDSSQGYGTNPRRSFAFYPSQDSLDAPSGAGDDHSLASAISEFYLRVRGKYVPIAAVESDVTAIDDEDDIFASITPGMAVLAVVLLSCLLLLFAFVNVYWVTTVLYSGTAVAGAYALFVEGLVTRIVCSAQTVWSSRTEKCYSRRESAHSEEADAGEALDEESLQDGESDALLRLPSQLTGTPSKQRHLEGKSPPSTRASALVSLLRRTFSHSNVIKVLSLACSVMLPVMWLCNRHTNWGWLLQDTLSVIVVTFILTNMKISQLSTLATLLTCTFVYDVFFVFIEPRLFGGKSIMERVAMQHATTAPLEHPEQGRANYCDKYPLESACHPDMLPMQLIVPALFTWNTYDSRILGLGDLLIPGLLTVWAARYDLRYFGSVLYKQSSQSSHGYFAMTIFGYGVGLCVAQTSLSYFRASQPALLYLVPCTLLPILYRAFREGKLKSLLATLPPMRTVALPVNEDKLEEYRRRQEVVRTTAAWPDPEMEQRVVHLDPTKTAVAPLPQRSDGQSQERLYKSVFRELSKQQAAGGGDP